MTTTEPLVLLNTLSLNPPHDPDIPPKTNNYIQTSNEPSHYPKVRFRNYTPIDPNLNKFNYITQLPPLPTNLLSTSLSSAKVDMALLLKDDKTIIHQSPLKRNEDLKKRIQGDLKQLERRTNKVLGELVREKIERQAREEEELERRRIYVRELDNVIEEDNDNNEIVVKEKMDNTVNDKDTTNEHDRVIQVHETIQEDSKDVFPTEENKELLDENEIELE